jgi:hypothetical protein
MKARRRRIHDDTETQSGGPQLLALSLFIMLLAFFIVLNAKSTLEEEKVKPVMASVAQSFSNKIMQDLAEKPSVTESAQLSTDEGDALARISNLFKAEITTAEIVTNRQSGVMMVRFTRDEYDRIIKEFSEGTATSAGGRNFLTTLATILRSERRNHPYRMDITFYTADNPARMQNAEPAALSEIMTDIAQGVRVIEQAGLPGHLASIGLQRASTRDETRLVEIFIHPHIPYNPDKGGKDGG